jgi:transcriptional regulator with XRE-family HTH domain
VSGENEKRAAVCRKVMELLAEKRKLQGLSMNQLSKLAGMTQPAISILEASQPNPKLDTLLRLCSALQVDLVEVIEEALDDSGFPRGKKR